MRYPKAWKATLRWQSTPRGGALSDRARPLYEDEPYAGLNSSPVPLTFVPYFARGTGLQPPCRVWVPELEVGADLPPDH